MRKGGRRYSSPQSPGIGVRRREGCVERGVVVGIEREAEDLEVVGAVLALAEPRADDRCGDGLVLEHPARGDVGDRDAVLRWRCRRRRARMPWNTAQPPAASMKRLYFERLQSAMAAGSGWPSQRSDRKPPHSVP